ncbi:L-threonylcarbamoyladenylate synthase [Riemerella columbina]|uniref:L-threonylcarbamoyladenylate synthase n=1 Tax=Riemerella columbina TaxID=103810 RepID=UPI0026707015|nr:L-threonylcarbamoyladenylate synthase [Riemerella columbina]WKS94399.1 L-threonylcarbamoyladenylate synthase [Riemerella columbina]
MDTLNWHQITETLKSGGTLLYPTDTIWGIGCDATNADAIERVYQIKNRDLQKPMIILVDTEKRLQDLVEVPEMAWEIIDLSEKPVTIIYDQPKGLPDNLLAEDGSIGIRLVKNQLCQQIIRKINAPLVSTSANFSGEKSPLSFSDISTDLKNAVDLIIPETQAQPTPWRGSSIIRIWNDNRIKVLRE